MNFFEKEKYFEKIYSDYYQRLCFYASKYIVDFAEAEDIVQNIYVKLWEKVDFVFENEYALLSYLYSAVYRACLNKVELEQIHIRHHKCIEQNLKEQELMDYEADCIENEVLWNILRAVDSLPTECKKIFKLSYFEGLEIAKVAELLHISENTVKRQRARGKKILQERLKNLYPILAIIFP